MILFFSFSLVVYMCVCRVDVFISLQRRLSRYFQWARVIKRAFFSLLGIFGREPLSAAAYGDGDEGDSSPLALAIKFIRSIGLCDWSDRGRYEILMLEYGAPRKQAAIRLERTNHCLITWKNCTHCFNIECHYGCHAARWIDTYVTYWLIDGLDGSRAICACC